MPSKIPMRALRIDEELYSKVCKIADLEKRSFNQECAYVLEKFVREWEAVHGPVPPDTLDTANTPDSH